MYIIIEVRKRPIRGRFYLNMDNTPVTIWRTPDGLNDNQYTGITYIIDTIGDFLVDPQGDNVIDTGVNMVMTPVTIWKTDNGI